MPDIPVCVLIAIASGSMANINNIGDRGHPWRVDRSKVSGLEIILFVKTLAVGLVYKIWIHLRNFCPNPYLGKTLNKYGHSILSKACRASNESTAVSFASNFSWIILRTCLMKSYEILGVFEQNHSDHYKLCMGYKAPVSLLRLYKVFLFHIQ